MEPVCLHTGSFLLRDATGMSAERSKNAEARMAVGLRERPKAAEQSAAYRHVV